MVTTITESWQARRFVCLFYDRLADALTIVAIATGLPWSGFWEGTRNAQLYAILTFSVLTAGTRRWLSTLVPRKSQLEMTVGAARRKLPFHAYLQSESDIQCNSPFLVCFLRYWGSLAAVTIVVALGSHFAEATNTRPSIVYSVAATVIVHPLASYARVSSMVSSIRILDGIADVGYHCGASFRVSQEHIVVIQPSIWAPGTDFSFPSRVETVTRIVWVSRPQVDT